ncbi:class I SAM-dependent methyltransferase [Betaproteobacteria bacterium PRO7]|jgi:cyclopropane-fatty-acyl-phospholipid synthase|nr:class I SAM-dependent methyltransferase [Betaproteobacteria bacterium PRO7]
MRSEDATLASSPTRDTRLAIEILARLFRTYPRSLAIRVWSGETLGIGQGPPEFTLVFKAATPLRDLVLGRGALRLAEAYFRGEVDVEGDLGAALALKDYLEGAPVPARDRIALALKALRLRSARARDADRGTDGRPLHGRPVRRHSRRENKAAVGFHYDVSNEFYRLWLDEQMVYSCAYFETAEDSLDRAQRNKLDYICRKLRLKRGERFLDIGCGWGALVIWAARHYGVRAHGVTLSRNQHALATERVHAAGLHDRASVELLDYRDLEGRESFDKIASVGMFEHVGLENLPTYFGAAHRLLKPGGLFLNHGITHDAEGWQPTTATQFINRYVFPDGQLDTVSNVQRVMERCGFEILDVEALRPHYALTLRHWVRRLERARAQALQFVAEPAFRVWRLYMTACARQFEQGDIGVHQILAAKRAPFCTPVPLTRRDLYA